MRLIGRNLALYQFDGVGEFSRDPHIPFPARLFGGGVLSWGPLHALHMVYIRYTSLKHHLTAYDSRYKSDELGLRMAYLGCGAALGTSFGSVIESGILATMEGKLGYPAWRSESRKCFIRLAERFTGGCFLSKVVLHAL